MKKLLVMIVLAAVAGSVSAVNAGAVSADIKSAWLTDFDVISRNIEKYHPTVWEEYRKVASQTLNSAALIHESDKTPVDVILRRTQALLDHLNAAKHQRFLDQLRKQNRENLSVEDQKELFVKIAELRREISFSNPLLNFDSMIFLKHNRMVRGESHIVDQYLGLNQERSGGIFRLDNPFSNRAAAHRLLQDLPVKNGRLAGQVLSEGSGSFLSLELDYDAGKVLFAYSEAKWEGWDNPAVWTNQPWTKERAAKEDRSKHYYWKPESSFHIFEADLNGDSLRQLTDGQWDDFDPCYLPNGRIVFTSSRIGGNQRCGVRYAPTYTLHAMMSAGSDVQPLSFHDTNEWFPSVDNNGMILYTRWDYVDRDADAAHHLWFCYPDGRDPRSMHGNYPKIRQDRPWFEGQVRATPGSGKLIGVAAAHHGETYGSLIQIDQSIPDDRAMSQVKRITPFAAFPEGETTPGRSAPTDRPYKMWNLEYQQDWDYGTPWPLSEQFYLCVYAPDATKHRPVGQTCNDRYGIYLVDCFGNREPLYLDPEISCLDPIPLHPRRKPPVHPTQTTQMKADREPGADLSTGTIAIMNIYDGKFPLPRDTKITHLRVINLFSKDTAHLAKPQIGMANESLARGVLGIVPVEEDGSVYFECPTGASIYFQALDENGMMVQNMRSATYLHPGEQLTCIGCHEDKWEAPKITGTPMALRRAPSTLQREVPGSYPLSFPRLVQPVLDKHCVGCHSTKAPKKGLRGDRIIKRYGWSEAMTTLAPYSWGKHGGNFGILKNKRSYSIPMQEGARVSKLYNLLAKGHHEVKLTPEEMRRITLWLDCNSNFFGAYKETEKQAQGDIVLPAEGLPQWSDPQPFIY